MNRSETKYSAFDEEEYNMKFFTGFIEVQQIFFGIQEHVRDFNVRVQVNFNFLFNAILIVFYEHDLLNLIC